MRSRTTLECDFHAVVAQKGDDFAYLLKRCREIGFDYCATGVRLPVPVAEPKTILENNYSSSWREKYQQANYLATDPCISHTLNQKGITLWSETHNDNPSFWEDAFSHDLKHGVSIAMRDSSGALGMLSMSRGKTALCPKELQIVSLEVARLGEMFAITSFKNTIERFLPESTVDLTRREAEVLRWTADGKTSEDIATILSLSVNTVNFHVKQTLLKLSAVNKTQAVVKALLLHLI